MRIFRINKAPASQRKQFLYNTLFFQVKTITVRFREDKQFEGESVQQPIPDFLLVAATLYEQFMRQVDVGDIFYVGN
jgi:hypothetical protein